MENNHDFVTFHQHEQRIAALEADLQDLMGDLLAYVEADMACSWVPSAQKLAVTLRKRLRAPK